MNTAVAHFPSKQVLNARNMASANDLYARHLTTSWRLGISMTNWRPETLRKTLKPVTLMTS
jgi:hypothetical protein